MGGELLETLEERIQRNWGVRGPCECRMVRDDPFRRTWWMDTRNGPVMIKWFGNPDEYDTVIGCLRLLSWAAQQGAPLVQLWPLRDGSLCLTEEDGVLAVFEYVDGAVGVGDWRALGRAVGRMHTLAIPEFAQRSTFCPRSSTPEAEWYLKMFLGASSDADLLAGTERALELLLSLPDLTVLPIGVIHTETGIAHTITRATGEVVFLDTLDIGIGPFVLDFPPILCEYLSHLDASGRASHLNVAAAHQFFDEYERFRPIRQIERDHLLAAHRVYHICHAARDLDHAMRSGVRELLERARAHFRWLDYVEKMVDRDLIPVLASPGREHSR